MKSLIRILFPILIILALSSIVGYVPEAYGQLNPGDILVTDREAGVGSRGVLFRIDPATGTRTILSMFGNATQGPVGVNPAGVAVESSGKILVIDPDAGTGTGSPGALFRVDPSTGTRTVLSNFGDATQGPLGPNPSGIAVESSGQILVTDTDAGSAWYGALFRVDPVTGARTTLTNFGDGVPFGENPFGVAVESSGQILVMDRDAGGRGLLFRVNPTTGARVILSNFGDATQGPFGVNPIGVAVESSGRILVIDEDGSTGKGALFRIDPATGARTILSDLGVGTPLGSEPSDLDVEALGQILVVDRYAAGTGSRGALFRIDPDTGARAILSNFGDATQGPVGQFLFGVAVVPTPAVGGSLVPLNGFDVLTPYFVLLGSVAVVCTAYAMKRWKA